MNKKQTARMASLLPNGIPRWIRCYDNGGTSADRYTVCYTGRSATERATGYPPSYPYVGMSSSPMSPWGVGMHGSCPNQPCDTIRPGKRGWAWPPAMGRSSHIGKGVIADGPEVRTHALRVRNPHGEIMSEKHDKNKSFYVVLNGKKMRFYVVEVVGSAFYVELLNVATLKVEQN